MKNKSYNKLFFLYTLIGDILKLLFKLLVVTIISLVSLIGIKKSNNIKKIIYDNVYDKNISFATINKYYKKYFGTLNILEENTKPVFSENIEYTKKEDKDGVLKLFVSDNYLVPNLESGLVTFIGEKEGLGKVVIVEQVNGINAWYGNLDNINVKLYDYIEKGNLIGDCNNYLYLIHKKDNKVISYEI